jgi:peptidoglycan hydrolase-like amidase
MVFLGRSEGEQAGRGIHSDPALLRQLNALTVKKGLEWLPFSKGGTEKWVKQVSAAELLKFVNEPAVLDLRRERTRNGEVMVHLIYPEAEESVPCEVFRNRLKLLSCPDVIRRDEAGGVWFFEGIGEGHGQGLSMDRARALALAGKNARAILADAYR